MSELAVSGPRSPAVFAACWNAPETRSRGSRARPTAILASLVLHVAALLIGMAAWHPAPRVEPLPAPSVRVTMLRAPKLLRPAAAPAPAPAPASPPRAAPPKRLVPPQPAAEPLPTPAAEPAPATEISETGSPDAGAAGVAGDGAKAGASAGGAEGAGSTGEPAGAAVEPPPAISPERRQVVLASYLQEVFRSRIAAHFQYPEEAERLGMEGLVVVRASVLPTGALGSARIIGDCPQRILCAAAERTVRAAAPFPPPPAELGGAISIDVPLNYRLE